MISERLQKVVNMAKNGTGNEKAVAERLVRRECQREGLDYDDVMDGKLERKETIFHDMTYSYWPGNFSTQYYNIWQDNTVEQKNQMDKAAEAMEKMFRKKREEATRQAAEKLRRMKEEFIKKTAFVIKDKVGRDWTVAEIHNLTPQQRFYFFGRDPINF